MKRPHASALVAHLLVTSVAWAAAPSSDLQSKVRAATFEVVVPKPAEDSVSYDRPPRYELLPFAERNDKFWPVGTAFAISRDTFVTAGHVLTSAISGMGGPPQIRDAGGRTYAIERVLKYSMHEDFAVFEAAASNPEPLATSTENRLDETVFAVGNALGEGVVVRDGLLTSYTPEERDGRWKWLRYSAATSPGNSGGPLMNERGEVIGVVVAKSPGENLNYALPIGQVLSAPVAARADVQAPIAAPVLVDSSVANFQLSVKLPLPLADFDRRLREAFFGFNREELGKFIAGRDDVFPRGKSEKLLVSVKPAYCPGLLGQEQDRTWEIQLNRRETTELADGGEVCIRNSDVASVFHIDRGKATDADFFNDRRAAMDMLLKAAGIRRAFGGEVAQVTSLGPASSDMEHRDRYGRRWRLATFGIPFLDAHIGVLFLPTPDGYAGMLQFAGRGLRDAMLNQLRFLSDYAYVSYQGTLPQWHAFLARADLRPAALDTLKLTRDAAGLHYRSRRIDFDVPPELLSLTDDSVLSLQMSYALVNGDPVWDVGAIYVSTDEDEKAYIGLIRQPKPPRAAGKESLGRWADMLAGMRDFVPERGHDANFRKLWRRSAVGAGQAPGGGVDPAATLLYEVVSTVTNASRPRQIDDMHDVLLENVRVRER